MPLKEHNNLYKGLKEDQINFIKAKSWGASLSWIYFMFNSNVVNVLLSLVLILIPLVNILFIVYLVNNGRIMSWKSRDWSSFDEFKLSQDKWDKGAKNYWIVAGLIIVSTFLFIFVVAENANTQQTSNNNPSTSKFQEVACPTGQTIQDGGNTRLKESDVCSSKSTPATNGTATGTSNYVAPVKTTPATPTCDLAKKEFYTQQYNADNLKSEKSYADSVAIYEQTKTDLIALGSYTDSDKKIYEDAMSNALSSLSFSKATNKQVYEAFLSAINCG